MRTYMEVMHLRFVNIAVELITAIVLFTNQAMAFPTEMRRSFLAGPWELLVQMGTESQQLSFPVTVSDEEKPEKLDRVLPVMGTPIKIRLQQYLPDLKWETTAVKHSAGGIVARLTVRGENLKQDIWLSSEDPVRQSISSRVGAVAIRKLYNPHTLEKLLRELTHPQAVGVVSVWVEDTNSPLEYVVRVPETLTLPDSKYKISILGYIPHYSIDTETKKVVSRSDKPINPAIKVSVDDGENTYEQWLWAKFPLLPHKELKLPLRMRFTDFRLGSGDGKYIIVAARGSEPWLLFSKTGKIQLRKAIPGQSYPFANKKYSFIIEKVFDHAVIKMDWKNGSESLLHPAIVVVIEQNSTVQQAILEFNKPYHHRTRFGTMVLIYRPQRQGFKAAN